MCFKLVLYCGASLVTRPGFCLFVMYCVCLQLERWKQACKEVDTRRGEANSKLAACQSKVWPCLLCTLEDFCHTSILLLCVLVGGVPATRTGHGKPMPASGTDLG